LVSLNSSAKETNEDVRFTQETLKDQNRYATDVSFPGVMDLARMAFQGMDGLTRKIKLLANQNVNQKYN
jgi:propanediol dehydratase small subunit